MIPATRARLCAALERETGRGWAWESAPPRIAPLTICVTDPHSNLGCWPADHTTVIFDGAPWDVIAKIPTPTGRNWPERLAAEVARVLSETSTTGEKP